jgi:alpha-galactosidase
MVAKVVYGQDSGMASILTPKPALTPRINSPKVFGVRPGHPILFTIACTGEQPMKFSAEDLPKGVQLDKKTGGISGSISKAGTYIVRLKAENAKGKTIRDLKVIVGETIALTPPMGWNSWNVYGPKVTQELVLANAKAMVNSGLVSHGWSYINIDDVWQGKQGGEFHTILPDSSTFPDMQQLVNEVHDMGLKIGIYSTPRIKSYAGRIGGTSLNPKGTFEKGDENFSSKGNLLT